MRPLVVDASVAVKWFVPEERSAEADEVASSGCALRAPNLIRIEVASALTKKARRKLVQPAHVSEYVGLLPRYFEQIGDHEPMMAAAIAMSVEIDHPLYDCIYVEMARMQEATLVTDDLRLLAKLRGSRYGSWAVGLGQWKDALA